MAETLANIGEELETSDDNEDSEEGEAHNVEVEVPGGGEARLLGVAAPPVEGQPVDGGGAVRHPAQLVGAGNLGHGHICLPTDNLKQDIIMV